MKTRATLAVALLVPLVPLACATSARRERPPETSAARALPEPDPECRGMVQQRLLVNGLEQIAVELAVSPTGEVKVLDVLAPSLTPAQAEELKTACAGCLWTPGLLPARERKETVVIEAR